MIPFTSFERKCRKLNSVEQVQHSPCKMKATVSFVYKGQKFSMTFFYSDPNGATLKDLFGSAAPILGSLFDEFIKETTEWADLMLHDIIEEHI